MRTTVFIQGMHCTGCVNRLTEAFQNVPGVTAADVTLTPPQAHLESDGLLPMDAIRSAARTAGGYSATPRQGLEP